MLKHTCTHAHTSSSNSPTSLYCHLEFPGDAIVGFLIVKCFYNKYPCSSPAIISGLKNASISNKTLGAICEIIGLQEHIVLELTLSNNIETFVSQVKKRNGKKCYWDNLEVPEVMSNIIKSMLGAIFVDSRFETSVVQNVFDFWIKPVLEEHITFAVLNSTSGDMNPVEIP